VLEVKARLLEILRAKDRLVLGGLNMEPFEVLRDIIRSKVFSKRGWRTTVGESLRDMNVHPFGSIGHTANLASLACSVAL
jgi:hypothetical protein